jgi:uncharacterized membrane protein (DUF2068 family)
MHVSTLNVCTLLVYGVMKLIGSHGSVRLYLPGAVFLSVALAVLATACGSGSGTLCSMGVKLSCEFSLGSLLSVLSEHTKLPKSKAEVVHMLHVWCMVASTFQSQWAGIIMLAFSAASRIACISLVFQGVIHRAYAD